MKKSKSGYLYRPYGFKDWSHRKIFGASVSEPIIPIGRKIDGVPIVYQGPVNSCVSCTITWLKSWLEAAHPSLSWQWLASISNTGLDGAVPGDVIDAARQRGIGIDIQGTDAEKHKLGGYYYVDCNPTEIYSALKKSPLAIGVANFRGDGPHFMCAVDVTADGKLVCENWWLPTTQDQVQVDMSDVVECIGFGDVPVSPKMPVFSPWEVICDKAQAMPVRSVLASLLATFAIAFPQAHFGSAGVYDVYAPAIAGSGISSTDTFIPVSTFTLSDGTTIATSTIQFPAYFVINPNSTTDREKVECNALDSVNLKFTNCYRAISCNNLTNSTSTISGGAYPHPAGEKVIMSNDNCFFNRFVDVNTNQNVGGIKTFTSGQVNVGSTTTEILVVGGKSGWTDNGGASTFTFAAGGSGLTASTTKGIFVTASQIGINASTTQGLLFDGSGNLAISASSTSSTNGGFLSFNALGQLYWNITSFLASAWTWAGAQTFNGVNTFNANNNFTSGVFVPSISRGAGTGLAANDLALNNFVSNNEATGTTGIAVTAGQALYMSSTSTLFQTNSGLASSTFQFIGIAANTVGSGATVFYTKPGGINCSQSGLSTGYAQFLNGSSGQISATPGTLTAKVGFATSATCIQVSYPKYFRRGTFITSGTGNYVQNVGFYPARVDIYAATTTAFFGGAGISIGNDGNTSISYGNNNSTFGGGVDQSNAIHVNIIGSGANPTIGTVSARDTQTFTINISSTGNVGNVAVNWEAFSE